nr:hypothetical protein StreXyl84_62170 [Streptomyces sp. Xyl84]
MVVGRLAVFQRAEFRQGNEAMTEVETDPGRREFLHSFPDGFGLVEQVTPGSGSGHEETAGDRHHRAVGGPSGSG